MKKIDNAAVNRSATAKKTDIASLKKSGVTVDILVFRKGDKIVVPEEELAVWVDSFTPKGSNEKKEFYKITVEFNDQPYDATMASFRRTKMLNEDDLDKVLANPVLRTLHNLGDDEQRAEYLKGKILVVSEVSTYEDKFRENHKINIPWFEIQ